MRTEKEANRAPKIVNIDWRCCKMLLKEFYRRAILPISWIQFKKQIHALNVVLLCRKKESVTEEISGLCYVALERGEINFSIIRAWTTNCTVTWALCEMLELIFLFILHITWKLVVCGKNWIWTTSVQCKMFRHCFCGKNCRHCSITLNCGIFTSKLRVFAQTLAGERNLACVRIFLTQMRTWNNVKTKV